MKSRIVGAAAVLATLVCTSASAAADGNFQILQSDDGNIWRMDTRTGEIVMCHADGARMVCSSSGEDVATSSSTPEEIEAAKLRAEAHREDLRAQRFERMLGMFERMLDMAQKQQAAAAAPTSAPSTEP